MTHETQKNGDCPHSPSPFPPFPLEKYNETALVFHEIARIYFETGKIGYLSQQGSGNINKSLTEFSKKSNELVRDVLEELEKSKNLIA